MSLTWNGARAQAALLDALEAGVRAGTAHYSAAVQARIGIQGPPRSRPGEAPHRDTGALQAGFFEGLSRGGNVVIGDVYTRVPYAIPLELHRDRPYIRVTLAEERARILDLIAARAGAAGAYVLTTSIV